MESKGKKILIADDEPDILEIIQYNLTKEGYEVITAKDGDEAVGKAKIVRPDLIILDIMMPKKNGVEVCEILRSQPSFKETLILFLTALSDEGSHVRGLETGADDYVTKPISPKVLISRVNALFRRVNKEPEDKVLSIEPDDRPVQIRGDGRRQGCHAGKKRVRVTIPAGLEAGARFSPQ